ncbi:MAG: hydrogenase [Candidatus Brocadiae bacterium]|nr:hydrogenase [Candidatus Brocadiia bacterium]
MEQLINIMMVVILLTNLLLLGSSRLGTCIPALGFQGILLGLMLPVLLLSPEGISIHTLILVLISIPLRGLLFPWILFRIVKKTNIRREIEPFISYPVSIFLGMLALVLAFWMSSRLAGTPIPSLHPLMLPVAFYTILVGLILIVSRKLAINQVLGYIVLENGMYVLGIAFAGEVHLLLELGVLMDVFVAVFVMSIAIYRISREFSHIDVNQLQNLKD